MFMEGEKQMATQQISVFLENKPGTLAEFCKVLEKNNIDMRAMCVADAMDFGIVRVIVKDVYETATVLKDAGYICSMTPVVAVMIPDEVGGLSKVLSTLGKVDVNVEYMYASLAGKVSGSAYMIIRVEDIEKAEASLLAGGFTLATQDAISEM